MFWKNEIPYQNPYLFYLKESTMNMATMQVDTSHQDRTLIKLLYEALNVAIDRHVANTAVEGSERKVLLDQALIKLAESEQFFEEGFHS